MKTDLMTVKMLELLALVGDMSTDEIRPFFNSESYVRKLITKLKNDKYIKKSCETEKISYRLTNNGKKELHRYLPEIFQPLLSDRKSMNVVRNDKGYKDRRKKLLEVLTVFQRADVKIFPDEKFILRKIFLDAGTDNADTVLNCQPEFYTAVEIKEVIPDFNVAKGSRSLGILISYGKIYVIYYTYEGDLLWRKETEIKFRECVRNCLARKLFGNKKEVYLMVLADKEITVETIMNRYKNKSVGKIYPSYDLPDMIFALKDTARDATLELITQPGNLIWDFERNLCEGLKPDMQFPFFSGRSQQKEGLYYRCFYQKKRL